MSDICDFGRILNKECNLNHYSRQVGLLDLNEFKEDESEILSS